MILIIALTLQNNINNYLFIALFAKQDGSNLQNNMAITTTLFAKQDGSYLQINNYLLIALFAKPNGAYLMPLYTVCRAGF